ncbi:ATP-binding protein [Actinophytocola sp.]|uniref:ATP-binding protein n=1 Tax=Actinophytocola sp. TaxID=1872138 RepID=UPI003D6A0FEB
MQDQTAQVDDLRLVALPSAVNCAELFVRFTLTEWHVPQMVDDVRETAKRLVQSVIATVDEGAQPTMITVRLRLRGNTVVVEVQDDRPSPRLVVPRGLSGKSTGVETLSRGRQLVWCELPLPSGMDATVVPLPRRGTTRAAAPRSREIDEAVDLNNDVMQRILDGLRKDDPTI